MSNNILGKSAWPQTTTVKQIDAAKISITKSVIAPGVPKNYPDAKKLVTEDCIKP